jgi:hypothetical protein
MLESIKEKVEKSGKLHPVSKFLLENGECIIYHIDFSLTHTGEISYMGLIVKYNSKYYHISYDNFPIPNPQIQAPEIISKTKAKKLLSRNAEAWEQARKLGWWKETLFEYFGIKKEVEND